MAKLFIFGVKQGVLRLNDRTFITTFISVSKYIPDSLKKRVVAKYTKITGVSAMVWQSKSSVYVELDTSLGTSEFRLPSSHFVFKIKKEDMGDHIIIG